MSNESGGVIDVIGAVLLLYVLFVILQNLWPMLSETEFGQQVVDGVIQGVVILAIVVVLYLIANAITE